jgi:hypothetical protein
MWVLRVLAEISGAESIMGGLFVILIMQLFFKVILNHPIDYQYLLITMGIVFTILAITSCWRNRLYAICKCKMDKIAPEEGKNQQNSSAPTQS